MSNCCSEGKKCLNFYRDIRKKYTDCIDDFPLEEIRFHAFPYVEGPSSMKTYTCPKGVFHVVFCTDTNLESTHVYDIYVPSEKKFLPPAELIKKTREMGMTPLQRIGWIYLSFHSVTSARQFPTEDIAFHKSANGKHTQVEYRPFYSGDVAFMYKLPGESQ